jgi:hypothetical protein
MINNKIFLSTSVFCLLANVVLAQPGSTGPTQTPKTQSIDINSAYKPVLRNAVKINLSGSTLPSDTSLPTYSYKIPTQNLFYAYKPIALKPLALDQDTNLYLGNRNFVKVGFGNFTTPYLKAGLSMGDGKQSLVNFYVDYVSSKGSAIKYQDFSEFNAKAAGSYFMPKNELYASVDLGLHNFSLYGYDKVLYPAYTKDDLKQSFQDFTIKSGIKNTTPTETGVNYNPNVEISVFNSRNKLSETGVVLNLPFDKVINDNASARIEVRADLSSYNTKNIIPNNTTIKNTIVQIMPSVNLYNDNFKLHAGVTPAWNNNKYEVLPDIYGEAKIKDKLFSVQAGWVGRLEKNSYRNLSMLNPYLAPMFVQLNTKETEFFGGIKASIAKHFNFSAKAGLVTYKNLPFFVNDTAFDNKTFKISNEKSVQNFRIHGDFSYINQDKFSLNGGITFNGYTLMQSNARAWHTIPLEITASLRWWAVKTVLFKSDLRVFEGSNYLVKGNTAKSLKGGTDLSAGVEVKLNKKVAVWADANNLFNSKYERWKNYEVYGANFVGGILLHF